MHVIPYIFFFNDTATTEIYTLSLHDALPISVGPSACSALTSTIAVTLSRPWWAQASAASQVEPSSSSPSESRLKTRRSEEHTSELQSRQYLVCRLLLEKKKQNKHNYQPIHT